ncbi:3-oxoacyl-ACP synthase [Arthrobacter sp. SW1]|uniref:beta-ketoacyl-ACP synthase III n=1 Tax=Arthrobacter sp. SW1 TaxID=1920889 RepID=UPI000877B3A8|nr:beta-ketoacyl-ACP synthase III [Arthrobacter sp. SW1]OFI39776.1 3-oxoacyl-ACP synthase [Arthrobacter sp. SW1]
MTLHLPALPSGPAGTEIRGLGHAQPLRVMDNFELEKILDTNDEWIRQRTGIVTRHIAGEGETVATLATDAARMALADSGVAAEQIDLVVVATTTSQERSPNTAGRIAQALQLGVDSRGPGVIEINTACSGFEYALGIADQAIRSGSATHAIVAGAETLSAVTDWTDRTTAVLVADGAGAAVVGPSDEPRIGPVVWGSRTDMADAVLIGPPNGKFAQNGREVLRWGLLDAVGHARDAVERAGLTLDDIEVLVAHQANLRIIEPLAKGLGLSDKVVVTDVTESGNTSAASVPLGLSKWWHSGRIPSNVPALLFGFGGGFTYAGMVAMTPTRG